MWKLLFASLAAVHFAPIAQACSCICSYEHSVSTFAAEHTVFWGVPTKSVLSSEHLVTSTVEVIEGYGQHNPGDVVSIASRPEDGGTCGIQLRVGVLQLIVASKAGDSLTVSTCQCTPPLAYLIRYLKTGEDVFLPNLENCRDEESGGFKSSDNCRVLNEAPDDFVFRLEEERRVRELVSDTQ